MAKRPESWWENRYPNGMDGKNHPRWKGGIHIEPTTGYRRIWIPGGKGHGKYIREHRFIMSQSLGRQLRRNEFVHHKDGDKLNNDISNLVLVSFSIHNKIHYPIPFDRKKWKKEYRQKNKQKLAQQEKAYRLQHIEKYREYDRKRYAKKISLKN